MSIRLKCAGVASGLFLALGVIWTALFFRWCLWPWLQRDLARGGAPAAASLTRALLLSGGVTVACAAACGVVVWWLSGTLHTPLVRLTAAARSAAGGEPGEAAAIVTGDEIAALAQAFGAMMERFSASHAEFLRSSQSLSQRTKEVNTLNTLATAALRAASPEDLLRRAFPQVCESLGARHGEVLLWDEDQAEFTTVVQHGSAALLAKASEAAALSRQHRRAVVLPSEDALISQLPVPADVVALPLVTTDRFVGAIVALRERPGEQVSSDVFLDSLALQLHVALERVSLWQEARMLGEMRHRLLETMISAQEGERARVARELHDATGQELTCLLLALRSLELSVEDSEARARVSEMRGLATAVLATVRSVCTELMPRGLDELGLGEALEAYVREFEQRHPVSVDFEVAGDCRRVSSHEAQLALYRIVQEALTNVARHAQATHASVTLACRGGDVVAIVEDNGVGFDDERIGTQTASRRHLGLFGMRERAELLGGKVTVEATPGGGTTVYAAVPMDPSGICCDAPDQGGAEAHRTEP